MNEYEWNEYLSMNMLQYEYVKRKYCEKAKLCYMDTDRFIVHIKTDYIYKHIADDVEQDLTSRFAN